jgi:hypothetical protein
MTHSGGGVFLDGEFELPLGTTHDTPINRVNINIQIACFLNMALINVPIPTSMILPVPPFHW